MECLHLLCVCVLVLHHCPALYNPTDYSPPGSSVHGILQARILDLPDPGIKPTSPVSPVLQADSLPAKPSGKPPNPCNFYKDQFNSKTLAYAISLMLLLSLLGFFKELLSNFYSIFLYYLGNHICYIIDILT